MGDIGSACYSTSLRRIVAEDANITRKPRRSKDQLRQFSIALAALERDPLHNVKKAAEYAFKNATGYTTAHSLENVLRRKEPVNTGSFCYSRNKKTAAEGD